MEICTEIPWKTQVKSRSWCRIYDVVDVFWCFSGIMKKKTRAGSSGPPLGTPSSRSRPLLSLWSSRAHESEQKTAAPLMLFATFRPPIGWLVVMVAIPQFSDFPTDPWIWGFHKWGYSQLSSIFRFLPWKPSIWGYPHFWKPAFDVPPTPHHNHQRRPRNCRRCLHQCDHWDTSDAKCYEDVHQNHHPGLGNNIFHHLPQDERC